MPGMTSVSDCDGLIRLHQQIKKANQLPKHQQRYTNARQEHLRRIKMTKYAELLDMELRVAGGASTNYTYTSTEEYLDMLIRIGCFVDL